MFGVPPLPLLCRGGDPGEELGEVRKVFGGLVVSGGRGGGSRSAWGSREEGVGEVGEGPCDKGVSPGGVHEACKNKWECRVSVRGTVKVVDRLESML